MVNRDNLLPVARIAKSYHTDGEVVIKITSPFMADYKLKESVFLFFEGLPVPFFIENFTKRGNNGAIISFSTVKDFSHSEELLGKEIYINVTKLSKKVQKEIAADGISDSIIGFTLIDENGKEIGLIHDYIEYPNNSCIEVNDTLLPLHEDLILDVNLEDKKIQMQIPKGLISEEG